MNVSYISDRAQYLKLAAITISEGMRTGGFRSCFRGQGMEFDGVREYERGDDIRSIDWNVTARNGKPFVKMYREERELTVFLVVDASLSMDTGPGKISRREQALETAALVAFAAEQNASPVGSVVFDGISGKVFKPHSGKDQILMILSSLTHGDNSIRGSSLGSALAGATQVLRSRSLVVIISDFRTTGYEKALGIMSRKHDVLAIRITSPSDEELPAIGYLPFFDPETGVSASFSTSSAGFRKQWARENRESISHWEYVCQRRGVAPLLLSTEDDALPVLSHFFSERS